MLSTLCSAAVSGALLFASPPQGSGPGDGAPRLLRLTLEREVRQYLAADGQDTAPLAPLLQLAAGHEDLLADVLRTKAFLVPTARVLRRGAIDAQYRLVDDPAAANPALFAAPAADGRLYPLVVYVPDATDTTPYLAEIERQGADRGRCVFVVPDEQRDNRWNPTPHEHRRHTGPLRDLLLQYPIDPDRVYMIGSGRGGHATWDVGLLSADRWAGIFPCNGGLVQEGGYRASGGVFLENARCLAIFTVFNTSFDHGIESCRYAARKCKEWGCRFEAVEEPRMRTMGIAEALDKLGTVVRDAHPRAILKRFNHLDDGEHYWLRSLDRPHEWDPAAEITIHGEWPKERQQQLDLVWSKVRDQCAFLRGSIANNRIEITAHGVGRLRVYFDPELLDFRAKVTVVVNGVANPPLAIARRPEVLLQHVRETGDTARLYWDCADLRVPP
jgi:dienelactone hydrolase